MKHFGICLILLWTIPSSRLALRIVLLGKSGSGKSATGNTILGEEVFKEDSTFDSVTLVSLKESRQVAKRQITVVDTPGLFDTSKAPGELKSEIEEGVNMSVPGPHVFLLVIRLRVRFTVEERNAVKWIQENFGKRAAQFTMVLFTHADQLKGKSVENTLNEDLRKLIKSFGGGYHTFNNLEWDNQTQVEELLEKIDALVRKNDGEHYTNMMYQEAQSEMREEKEKIREKEDRRKAREEKEKKESEEEKRQKEERKKQEEERKRQEEREEIVKKVGTGVGAVVGAAAGMATFNPLVGAAIGGLAGAVAGYVVGMLF